MGRKLGSLDSCIRSRRRPGSAACMQQNPGRPTSFSATKYVGSERVPRCFLRGAARQYDLTLPVAVVSTGGHSESHSLASLIRRAARLAILAMMRAGVIAAAPKRTRRKIVRVKAALAQGRGRVEGLQLATHTCRRHRRTPLPTLSCSRRGVRLHTNPDVKIVRPMLKKAVEAYALRDRNRAQPASD